MANTLYKKKSEIYSAVKEAAQKAYEGIEIPDFAVETPKDKGHGDYAVNIAMLLARAAHSAPRMIAEKITENLDGKALGAEKIEIAGPGFINFYLDESYLYNTLSEIEAEGENYGSIDIANGKSVVVEFVSANPTGPMHMGNARGGRDQRGDQQNGEEQKKDRVEEFSDPGEDAARPQREKQHRGEKEQRKQKQIQAAPSVAGKKLLHPNDDINMSQSSNDTFPTAMHISALCALEDRVIPAVKTLIETFVRLEAENEGIVKSGRTHLQDATPIKFSQEISGWRSSLERDAELLHMALKPLYELALGGTAVGTGLNAPKGFSELVAKKVELLTGKPFVTAANKFHALTSKDEIVFAHGAIKATACDMLKIANDIRWLASGPRDGLGEIFIPENEPGSSIMPGKVNPTQCEAVTMVAVQVMGNDVAVGMAASQGNFELNVFMPVCAYNFLQSARLLAEAILSFNANCAVGIKAKREKMHRNLHDSLMLVTALNPYIGYENAAKTAKKAYKDNISLKEACVELGFLTSERFDEVFHPEEMV